MADEFEERRKAVLGPVFFEAGAALFDCQSFEYAVAYLLYLFSRFGTSGLDPTRCAAILDDEEKKTAGQLVGMLRQHLCISDGLEDGLGKALEARNRLVHRYLIENVERMADVGAHEEMVKEIRILRSTVRRGHKQLDPFVRGLAESLDGVAIDTWTTAAKEKFLRDTREH